MKHQKREDTGLIVLILAIIIIIIIIITPPPKRGKVNYVKVLKPSGTNWSM